MAFTSACGAPQLVEYVGVGAPKPMHNEPNDMHAVGAVLFQLLASTDAAWQRQYGEWIFGPMNKDIMKYIKLKKDGEQKSFMRYVLQREHKEWVRQTPAHATGMHKAALLWVSHSLLRLQPFFAAFVDVHLPHGIDLHKLVECCCCCCRRSQAEINWHICRRSASTTRSAICAFQSSCLLSLMQQKVWNSGAEADPYAIHGH